jgi:hypothetical protein
MEQPPSDGEARRWAVIAIDWGAPNVLEWWSDEEAAKKSADGFDALALRAVAVPEGHRWIRE